MVTQMSSANRVRGKERDELARELVKRVSGEVRFDPFTRVLYSTDASIYQMEPVGVVIPRTAEDVLAVVEVARDNGVPVLPRAGGTSLAGQTVNHAIVIDFSKHLNQVLEVNREEQWARIQPGIVLEQLNKHLASFNLQYAPDPTTANRACVGGASATILAEPTRLYTGRPWTTSRKWLWCCPTAPSPNSGQWPPASWRPS